MSPVSLPVNKVPGKGWGEGERESEKGGGEKREEREKCGNEVEKGGQECQLV